MGMVEQIKFVFIVPVGPGHEKYLEQWRYGLREQKYENVVAYTPIDLLRQGQVYWLNHFLDEYLTMYKMIGKLQNIYINYHGIDDYLQDSVLSKLTSALTSKNIRPEWFYGGHFQESARKRVLNKRPACDWDYKRLKRENYIAGGAVFVRADVYKGRRFRDLWFGQGADWDMWLRLGQAYRPMVLDEYIYTERIGTSLIRNQTGSLRAKIFNRIKYPLWRVQRGLWRIK
jgi:hypothetical protein